MVFATSRALPTSQDLSISPSKPKKPGICDKIQTLYASFIQFFQPKEFFPINELPEELRTVIFSYVKNASAIKSVCKSWLEEKNNQELLLCSQLRKEPVSTLLGLEMLRFKHLTDDLLLKALYQDLLDQGKGFPDMTTERPCFERDSLKEFIENIAECPLIELCKNDKLPTLKAIAEGKQSPKNKAQAIRDRLKLFPDEVKAAKAINLSNRNLKALPKEIELFTNVTFLNLIHNQISALPDSSPIWNLTQLTYLNLWGNPLTLISSSISRLTELEDLDIRGHKCTSLPESILDIKVVNGRETCDSYTTQVVI